MPEKLLTVEEASRMLGISEEKIDDLVKKGELPAYKIGGRFLRFRREQIEAIKSEISVEPLPAYQEPSSAYPQSISDKFLDFFYFNDFYVIAGMIILLLLWYIFQ